MRLRSHQWCAASVVLKLGNCGTLGDLALVLGGRRKGCMRSCWLQRGGERVERVERVGRVRMEEVGVEVEKVERVESLCGRKMR